MASTPHTLAEGGDYGTGAGFGRLVLILAGVSSLIAIIMTIMYGHSDMLCPISYNV
jgi:hypothetical protein